MSMLRKYFDEAERRYNYRIKAIIVLDEDALDCVERAILKYNPYDMSQVSKTILHRNPLDFPNVSAAEVYSVDVTVGLPVSPSVLRREVAEALGCHESEVMVRGENDPTEVETGRLNAAEDIANEEKDGEPDTLLMTAQDYPEHDEVPGEKMFGDKYNGRLLKTLKDIADERQNHVQKTHDYEEPKADVEADGGPEPDLGDAEHAETSKHGNLDDNTKVYKRVYKNGRVVQKDGVAVKRGN